MKLPFVDLFKQYQSIKDEIDAAISKCISDSSFIGGRTVAEFEKSFSEYLGVRHTIGCANGTDSLEIILKAWRIGEGDEVIVPASSWISTSEAVGNVGATPIFVDVEPDYYTIDVKQVEEKISERTKAIIPVHLYGHPADMPAICQIAEKYNVKVLEDCAQSHGASINDRKTGTFGHAASFSFYPGKNLGAYGDAGCMVTNDDDLADRLRMIANHGQQGKHNHVMEGRNSRLDGLQAAVLSVKLPYLERWTNERIQHAEYYLDQLKDSHYVLPKMKSGYKHVFHLFVVRSEARDLLASELKRNGVETAIHYPTALPFLPCYAERRFTQDDFPVAYRNQSRILSIPMFAELTPEQQELVVEQMLSFKAVVSTSG